MNESKRILVAVCTYNERENLPLLVEQLQAVLPEADLLVVDDNSPDGTGQWVADQAASSPRIHGIHRSGKLGLGSATVEAVRFAIERRYTCLVTLDADGSHDPNSIPDMLAKTNGPGGHAADVIIGSRYVPGGRIHGWPLHRRLMSRAVNAYARILLGLPTRDCSGAFRCLQVASLEQVPLDSIRSRGYSFFEEFLWLLKKAGATFDEIPIVFANRTRGKSKINSVEAFLAICTISRLGLRNWFGI